MKILHIAPLNQNRSSGLNYSIPCLIEAQNTISNVKADILISIKSDFSLEGAVYLNDLSKNELHSFLCKYDIVVFHSTYIPAHVKISYILKKERIPYIIVPRGGFSRSSKEIKRLKKYLGDLLLFSRFFCSPNAIHFLTENEMKESCYHTAGDFIVPNGIVPLKFSNRHKQPETNSIRFIYIGRIDSYIKGLDVLIESVNHIQNFLRNKSVKFYLYGPDSNNSKQQLNKLINNYHVSDIISIGDGLYGQQKQEALLNASVFIQTSRSEGMPMGVLEALSAGLPCIVTTGTNLASEVNSFAAGYGVNLSYEDIAVSITKIVSDLELGIDFQINSKSLAAKYDWRSIAATCIANYKSLLKM